MYQRTFLLLIGLLTVAGCSGNGSGRYVSQLGPNGSLLSGSGANSPRENTHAAAILLPLTGPRADLGHSLLQAAQLALRDTSGPRLDVLDTGGTAAGAVKAAQAAIANADRLILGPLTSTETAAVSPIARAASIPVLAFTNDTSQSQPGVWPLGISPDQQIQRLVTAAVAQGRTQFAALLPDSDFGHALETALKKATDRAGLPTPRIFMHGPSMQSITAGARGVAEYADRRGPIDARVKAARALGTADGRREAQELVRTPIPPPSFNMLLLGDTGDNLQEIAAILPYYDVDRAMAQIIGPALWADPSSGSGAVRGAWYAAPDNATRSNLERDYTSTHGTPPPPLADLSFDAASIAKVLLADTGPDISVLTQPGGFIGTDGWFALLPDGQVKRGLAVFRIDRGGPTLIEPAPEPSASSGF